MLKLRKVQRALDAILASTEFSLEAGGVRADVGRWNSPYVSRRKVAYTAVQARAGLRATAREWEVVVGVKPYECGYHAHPIMGCVGEWVGGRMPARLVRELLSRAEMLGLEVPNITGTLVELWTLCPALGAYGPEGPIWIAANGDNMPMHVSPVPDDHFIELDQEDPYRGFILLPAADVPPLPTWATWEPGESYGDVIRITPGTTAAPEPKRARRVVILGSSVPTFAIRADIGPDEVGRTSTGDVRLPEGSWIILASRGARDTMTVETLFR